MAAFEKISTVKFRPYNRSSVFDFRTARLPVTSKWIRRTAGPNDYNPRDHREPQQPIPIWMAYFNLIRTGFGAGMLGFPVAMSRSGIIFGPILGLFSAGLIMHMHLVLLNSLNEISRRLNISIISYRYGFRIAMLHGPPITHGIGRHGPTIVAVFMLMSQIGICAAFIDFTADSLRDILDWKSSKHAMLCLFFPYMILEFSMKTLRVISYVSLMGNVLNVLGLSIMTYQIFLEPHGEFTSHQIEAFPLSFCFGTFLFNLSAVGVILSLDKALYHPKVMVQKCGVITLGMGVPAVIAIVFGVLGYWSFGAMEDNVLRAMPYDDITTIIAAWFFTVAVAFAYPIQCHPAIQIILEVVRNHDLYEAPSEATMKLVELIARPSFVALTFTISYLLPIQALFVAFVGNLCTTMLALVFPALMELCLMYPGPYGKYNLYLIKDVLIIVLGVVSWIFGAALNGYFLYVSVSAIASPNDEQFV